MAVVLFYDGEPQLVLSSVERDANGAIRKAEVVNGAWTLVITDAEMQVKAGLRIVTRHAKPADLREIKVPDGGGYNDILIRAYEHV